MKINKSQKDKLIGIWAGILIITIIQTIIFSLI